jgi:hypothetical protein
LGLPAGATGAGLVVHARTGLPECFRPGGGLGERVPLLAEHRGPLIAALSAALMSINAPRCLHPRTGRKSRS